MTATFEDETLCAVTDCDRLALEWWWIWMPNVEGNLTKVFRHFCDQHAADERANDLAAFGEDGYVAGSEVGE